MNKFKEMLMQILSRKHNVEWNDVNIKEYSHFEHGVEVCYVIWDNHNQIWELEEIWIYISELIEQQINNK